MKHLFWLLLLPVCASAADVKVYSDFTVSWMPVVTTVDGGNYQGASYKLAWGAVAGGPYTNTQLTGSDTFNRFTGQPVGRHWCFIVTARAASVGDDDSDASSELCVLVVAKPVIPPPRKKLSTPQGVVISEGAAPP